MNIDTRSALTPQEFLRRLYAETQDGKVSIEYHPFFDEPYSITYDMDWTAEDAETLVRRYDTLVTALTRIGTLHDELETEADRKRLLTASELEIWDTYIRPFDPFEVDLSVIGELDFRSETETLSEEEQELLERHYEWFEANSLQRLPAVKLSPAKVINRARRYEMLVKLNAPQVIITEEGRFLAEEMALYYHNVQKPKPDFEKFIMAQQDVYAKALAEIRGGKKETHWMWFIFPQLRALGKSTTAKTYGIADLDEAKAYLDDIILGPRLVRITEELLKLDGRDAEEIFGCVDDVKLRSCMTLFAYADGKEDSVFRKVLQKYFGGEEDDKTIAVLRLQAFDFTK